MDFTGLFDNEAKFVILLGVIIVALVWVYFRQEKKIKEKDDQLEALAEKVVKVGMLWNVKSDENSKEHGTILKESRAIMEKAESILIELIKMQK